MHKLPETGCLVLAHLLLGLACAGVAAAAEEGGPAKVTLVIGNRQQTRLVAPGEWIPYTCSLAEMPSLRGPRITSSAKLSDLGPLAKATGLEVLKVESCKAITDIAPLAKLSKQKVLHLRWMGKLDLAPLAAMAQLVELDLTGGDEELDTAPFRPLIRRGLDLRVPEELGPQLEKLREADF